MELFSIRIQRTFQLVSTNIMRKMKNNHPHISSNMTLFIKLLSLYN